MEKQYDFRTAERQMQAFWEQEGCYRFPRTGSVPIYSIDTPPPTVSGSLHIGHVFSYTQAEMIARFRRMQGFRVFYPFGFDDNGLPTERLVERDRGISAKELPRSEFSRICTTVKETYEEEFRNLWKSLGFSVDWSLQYETVSPAVQTLSQQCFLELVQQGKAYEKESPVLWCTECQTSIAQAELEGKELESTFNYIPFTTMDGMLAVATTRPELLYGCVCLFVHPEDKRYSRYIGQSARVPLYQYDIPIWADDKVQMEKGTGVVMCATFGDTTDVEWAAKFGLPYRKVILPNGLLDDTVPYVGGKRVKKARTEILRLLSERQLLLRSEKRKHTVAVHERCGREVEIIPSKQWYIDILSEKERFLEAAEAINWYPAHMKSRYLAWVRNLKWDWCISRQRYFGVPFPVWYCKKCGKAVFAGREELPINPLEAKYNGACPCGGKEFEPEKAVLDTWATSSLTPQINEKNGLPRLPMSLRAQAHEIIRTWTFYTIVRSLYHTGTLPWKDIMISGFVLAKKGEKISKSKGNSQLTPQELIRVHSADAVRYWAANAKLGTDTFFSPEDLAGAKRFLTKLWNASRFAMSHLQDFRTEARDSAWLPADRWILARADETVRNTTMLLEEYEVGSARHEIDEFFWRDFCDNYLELVKDRLYQPDRHGEDARRSSQAALYHTLLVILKLYAIYVPHITEYLYQSFFRQREYEPSVHLSRLGKPVAPDQNLLDFGDAVKRVLFDVRKYKSEHSLSIKAELDCLTMETEERFAEWFRQTEPDILACSRAAKAEYIISANSSR